MNTSLIIFLVIISIIIISLIVIFTYLCINSTKPIKSWCKKFDNFNIYNQKFNLNDLEIISNNNWEDHKKNCKVLLTQNLIVSKIFCDFENKNSYKDKLFIFKKSNLFCSNKKEMVCMIQLINNKIVISWKGTLNINDVLTDVNESQIKLFRNSNIKVHKGFYKYFTEVKDDIYKEIDKIRSKHNVKYIISSGHSLGGAVSTLSSYFYTFQFPDLKILNYASGSPRVGNKDFVESYYTKKISTILLVNLFDKIPTLPSLDKSYEHVGSLGNKKGIVTFYSAKNSQNNNHNPFTYFEGINSAKLLI